MEMHKVIEGEFAGWSTYDQEPYEYETVGPFYVDTRSAVPRTGFRAERKHMNAGGVIHGGALMSFADFSLFAIAHDEMSGGYGVTVDFTAQFLAGSVAGQLITGTGKILRAGRTLVYIQGELAADDKPILGFTGTIMKARK